MSRRIPVVTMATAWLLSLVALQPGLDYYSDASPAVDALARGDLQGFFANEPLMGSLTLFLRAAFIKPVFHADLTVVYAIGALPCVAALVALVACLVRRARDRTRADRAVVVLVCLGSVPALRALHWGHPEDVLATACAVGSLLAADRGRAVTAGLLVGAAAASKQWGILAGLPVLLVLGEHRWRFFLTAAGVWALFAVPMAIGDPDRFWLVMRAAGSIDPTVLLNGDPVGTGAHVNPYDVWLPLAHRAPWVNGSELFIRGWLVDRTHPIVLVTAVALTAATWWHRGRLPLVDALKLFALIALLRCALDPMSLDYYHLPVLVALGAAGAVGSRRDLDMALLIGAGLAVAFAEPAISQKGVEHLAWCKFFVYMATVAPAVLWLSREVYDVRFAVQRARRSPRAQPA